MVARAMTVDAVNEEGERPAVRQVDFRAEGEAREYFGRLIVPAVIILLLLAIMAYAVDVYGLAFLYSRLIASSFFVMGIGVGAVLVLIIIRLYARKRFFDHVVAHSIRASDRNLPEINRVAAMAAGRLGMKAPPVYIVQDPDINAYAIGLLHKVVALNTGLIDAVDGDELAFIVGHELAHVKYGWSIPVAVLGITIPIPLVLSSKRREYTCDRGGLLASHNLEASIMALAKLALGKNLASKVDIRRLYTDKKEVEADRVSKLSEFIASHPPIKDRVLRLRGFYGSPLYIELTK